MNKILTVSRPLIWMKRFRHRCGYGVHSPFAFDFITNVIYEKTPYYAYTDIKRRLERDELKRTGRWANTTKVNRLLFRLANRVQPRAIIFAATDAIASRYLQEGCKAATFQTLSPAEGLEYTGEPSPALLYIHYNGDAGYSEKVWRAMTTHLSADSVMIVKGIHYSKAMRNLWSSMVADERTGITFDLYDLGIVFFDRKRIKQAYTVNF